MQKRRKRSTLIIVSVLAILIAVLGTYAWFTRGVDVMPYNASMGRVDVDATYDDFEEAVYLEPMPSDADPMVLSGVIDNVGTIDAAVKVDLRTKILIKSDQDGNPLPESEWRYASNPNSIKMAGVTIDEEKLEANDVRAPFIAIKDLNNPGIYYLLLPTHSNAGGDYDVDISLYVKPDKAMGNVFMGAELQFNTNNWIATQVFDEAIMDTFSVDLWEGLVNGDFEILVGDSGEPSMSQPFSLNNSLSDQLMDRVYLMLNS